MNALVRGVFYRVINMPPAQSLLHGERDTYRDYGFLNPLLLVAGSAHHSLGLSGNSVRMRASASHSAC
jgi:hypothetical protein